MTLPWRNVVANAAKATDGASELLDRYPFAGTAMVWRVRTGHHAPAGEVLAIIEAASGMFSPGIWWIGSTMNRSGSDVLAMYS